MVDSTANDRGTDNKKGYFESYNALRTLRDSEGWTSHWLDLQAVFSPRRGRFLGRADSAQSKTNRGKKKHQNIINNTPLYAANILASGMMAGITSPARPWFKLSTQDPDLAKRSDVKEWLSLVERILREIMIKSNLYKGLHVVYKDLGIFGTAAMSIEEDSENLIRAYPFEIGSYFLASNDRLKVDTIYRDIPLTVKQIVSKFGIDNVSNSIKIMYEKGDFSQSIDVIHGVEPNADRKHGMVDNKNMKFKSVYFEKGGDKGPNKLLGRSGFEEFPVMAPRWVSHGVDVYGASPGMDSLGDNRSMQLKEKRKDKVIDKIADPAMVGPESLVDASTVPGDITFIDGPVGGQEFKPVHIIDPRAVNELREDISDFEQRIKSSFFVDLFLMLSTSNRRDFTAREIDERHEEKLLMLGPVLENIHTDLLDPAIDRVFGIALRNGQIPPPPQAVQGKQLKVEYISVLAQAQKAVATNAIQDVVHFVGGMAELFPESKDKIDIDVAIDAFADARGGPPEIVRSEEKVQAIRGKRAQQEAIARQQEQAANSAQVANTMSQTPVNGGDSTILDELMGGV